MRHLLKKIKKKTSPTDVHPVLFYVGGVAVFGLLSVYVLGNSSLFAITYDSAEAQVTAAVQQPIPAPTLDIADYDRRMLALANYPAVIGTTTASTTPAAPQLWPAEAPYPNAGAILPFKRIVAYYGNFYSTKMGVLGEYPADEMLSRLRNEVANWEAADPSTPVMPAIDYIVMTAQESAGKDGMYRLRMPDSQIDHALELAKQVNGIVILEFQVGLSNVQTELSIYEDYLKMPQVHVALDPEFSMKTGAKPGTVIGTMNDADVNYAAKYLAKLVQENHLPPKVLIVHRFTAPMVRGAQNITPLPEVQVVIDMDGWGSPAKKIGTYNHIVADEPVQFTGFKLFYKNDLKPPSTRMLTPADVLKLTPQPIFIQYQ